MFACWPLHLSFSISISLYHYKIISTAPKTLAAAAAAASSRSFSSLSLSRSLCIDRPATCDRRIDTLKAFGRRQGAELQTFSESCWKGGRKNQIQFQREEYQLRPKSSQDKNEKMETLDTADCGLEMENSSSNHEIEDNYDDLENSIRQELTCLPPPSPLAENCICRVPRKLRQLNEAAYTPQMVSIGPLHHGEKHLKGMEEQKMRCLEAFLGRETINLEDCVKMIKKWEKRIRNCYAESIELRSDEFVKMILLDSSFIIEGMVKSQLNCFLRLDLLLLENQLPFFVLEGLFNLAFSSQSQNTFRHSFLVLAVLQFKSFSITNHNPDLNQITRSSDVLHFNDLFRIYHAPLSQRSVPTGSVKYIPIQNATALHKTGVKFRVGSSTKCLLDIEFNKGVLKIPHLHITDDTEQVLRNIIALECYLHGMNSYIIDYIGFMDNLIDSPEDVEILEKNGILENWLGDKSAVSNLFNKLATQVPVKSSNYYFYGISKDLNSYCKVPWHNWKATLKRDYFSSPWRVASTLAAIVLLVLTFIQTICSIISL